MKQTNYLELFFLGESLLQTHNDENGCNDNDNHLAKHSHQTKTDSCHCFAEYKDKDY